MSQHNYWFDAVDHSGSPPSPSEKMHHNSTAAPLQPRLSGTSFTTTPPCMDLEVRYSPGPGDTSPSGLSLADGIGATEVAPSERADFDTQQEALSPEQADLRRAFQQLKADRHHLDEAVTTFHTEKGVHKEHEDPGYDADAVSLASEAPATHIPEPYPQSPSVFHVAATVHVPGSKTYVPPSRARGPSRRALGRASSRSPARPESASDTTATAVLPRNQAPPDVVCSPYAKPVPRRTQRLHEQQAALQELEFVASDREREAMMKSSLLLNPKAKRLAANVTDYGRHDRRFEAIPSFEKLAVEDLDPYGYKKHPVVAKQVTERWLEEGKQGLDIHDHCLKNVIGPKEVAPKPSARFFSREDLDACAMEWPEEDLEYLEAFGALSKKVWQGDGRDFIESVIMNAW